MIVSPDLAGWLADPGARATTDAAMRALAGEFERIPAFAALKRGLTPAADRGAQAVLSLARAFIEDDAGIAALIAASVAASAWDPFCRPPLRATRNEVQDGLLLFSDPDLTIQLATVDSDSLAIKRSGRSGGAPIVFTGRQGLFRFLKGGGATLSVWTVPPIGADFTAAAAPRCRLRERRPLADGETVALDGRSESHVLDHATGATLYLFASTPLEGSPVTAEYDPDTLELVAASSADDASSRTQMMLALLRTLGRRDSAPLFAEQVGAAPFHARWQAMREFLALDSELALPHLTRMAESDPHPEVRDAAAETLAAFFPAKPGYRELTDPCHA